MLLKTYLAALGWCYRCASLICILAIIGSCFYFLFGLGFEVLFDAHDF